MLPRRQPFLVLISRIRETMNILMSADSSTDTKVDRNRKKGKKKIKNRINIMCHMSFVTCLVSCVMCHLARITCHLSLTLTVTVTDPPPAISPIMHSRLVFKDLKPELILKRKKLSKQQEHKNGKRYANIR